jgi:hypothetical protein
MCRGKSSLPIAILLVGFGAGKANAIDAIDAIEAGPQIPPALRPWAAWVLDTPEGKRARCPSYAGENAPVCAWPAHLALSVGERGGTFKQRWMVYAAGFVALPGDKEHWPRAIKVDGRLVPWVDSSGEPQVLLSVGHHEVTGSFAWDHQPHSLVVPSQTGLVRLTVKGKPISFPMRENDGRLFFGAGDEQEVEEEKVDVSVYRKLTDEVPLLLETRLTVAVSGKSREVMLARALPDGFEPRAVTSGLPLRFESDGHVRLQARPGRWDITLQSHRTKPDKSIALPIPDGLWKEGAEVWSFESVPNLRTVNIGGVQAMDPAQTLMPTEWKNLPAYAFVPGKAMTLTEQRRGDAEPAPEKLTLDRTLWLDSSGQGMSVHDTLVGDFTHSWRLDVGDGTRLGRASVGGQEQFITHYLPTQRDGVEIRAGHTVIETDGRMEGRLTSVPVAGFVHDLDGLVARVNLPVGWELLHASGADQVSGSWVERWSLGELFLLLLLALAVARLYGWRVGVLALLALGMTFVDGDAPVWLWLVVMAGEIAVLLPKPGPYLVGARVARIAAWAILIVSAIPFVMRQAQFALNPASVLDRSVPSRFVSLLAKENSAQEVSFFKSPQELAATFGRDSSATLLGNLAGTGAGEGYGIGGHFETLGRRHKGEEGEMGKKTHKARNEHAKEGLYALKGPKDVPTHQEREDKVMRAIAAANSAVAATAATTPAQAHPFEYDPSIVIQTGEGLPRQAWKMATFAFHGPVKSDHSLRLYFLSPQLGRALALVKLALLVLLVWLLMRRPIRLRRSFLPARPLFAGLLTLALLCPWSASADEFPADDLLESLQKRLLQAPECAPNCVSVSDMTLEVSPAQLHIQLQVSAAAPIAIALPGDNASWTPNAVTINGKPATALDHDSTGQLRLALGTGIFRVDLTGSLPKRDSIQLPLPMRPRHASFSARGFEVSGIHEDGAVDDSILLARIASATDAASELPESAESAPTLPPFFLVERTLSLGVHQGHPANAGGRARRDRNSALGRRVGQ